VFDRFNTDMPDPVQKQVPLERPPFDVVRHESSVIAKTAGSRARWARACRTLAGGVSSGLRRHARPYPLYFEHGHGSKLIDVDGNSYLDYTLAWGPNILGHAPPEIAQAIGKAVRRGLTFGAQHDLEFEISERLVDLLPCADQVCYANTGTEIVQLALRLSRAVTGRSRFIKFEGHYHGWDDSVLVSYHPTRLQIERANGDPIGEGLGQLDRGAAIVVSWNDVNGVTEAFERNRGMISAVICEPLLCNSGCIPPQPGFLEFLREITEREGSLLVFDEVITGFRLALGGAQQFYQVTPDLATYAKAIGGGAALSVLAGRLEFMQKIATGSVIHAGTLNGNPIALSAARTVLEVLSRDGGSVFDDLHRRGRRLRRGMEEILRAQGHAVTTSGEGPAFSLLFLDHAPRHYRDLLDADQERYAQFALALLDEGVLALPDGRWYISTAHSDADIDATLAAVQRVAES
jgi:glutamate-1-semialdehyde 2,1-aminomutase